MSEETFADYLKSNHPEVWREIERADLECAAVWSWPREKVAKLVFCGCTEAYAPRWLDVWDTEQERLPSDAWAGLEPDRFAEAEPYTDGERYRGPAAEKVHVEKLGADLNRAIAAWTGRVFNPQPGSNDARALCGFGITEAACIGDIAAMNTAFKRYGSPNYRDFDCAFQYAAHYGQVEFILALIDKAGTTQIFDYLTIFHYCDKGEGASAEQRAAVATVMEAGFPCPARYKEAVRIWAKSDPRFTALML